MCVCVLIRNFFADGEICFTLKNHKEASGKKMGCKLMIRNDVLQGHVGFVVGGGRKKGMGDLFTCPDLLVHSCC